MIMMKPPMYPMPNMGGMGGMGGMMSPMMPMMKMMQMMMRMMQGMMGGGCSPCGMPGMGGMGMPGMGGMGMPGMGGNGMGFMMGGTMNGMNGQMSFMLGGFLGAGQQNPGMMGPNAMAGIGQQSPMGKGGLRVEGDKVITPGGYSITFKGTDVTIEGMGKDAKKQQTQGQQGGFMAAGAFASSGPFGASAGAFMIGGFGGNQGPQQPEATGKTRVHGDPHVDEGDGGHWDWKDKTMSYNLPDGTKVTMEAKSAKGVVEKVDVYNGNDHVSGTKGKWDGGVTQDRMQADAAQADGDSVYAKGGDVSSWYHNPMGMGPEIAQQYGKK